VYFDARALVKLVVEEQGSDVASDLSDGCDAPLSSRLAYPEICAALAASQRNHDLGDPGFATAMQSWDEIWAATRPVELTTAIVRHADELARRRALGGTDAVHLASALAIGPEELVVAVWDRRLRDGVLAERLSIAPRTTRE